MSFDDLLKKFPSLDEYKAQLQKLRDADLSHCSQEDIKQWFIKSAILQPYVAGILKKEEFNKLLFYRVRLNINQEVEHLNLISTFSYPNPQFCKQNGRANIKGRSVFYCSDDAITSIAESKPKEGDEGFLSVWRGNTDRDIQYGIYLPKDLTVGNSWKNLSDRVHDFTREKAQRFSKEKYEHIHYLNEFIAEQFVVERPPYCITSWVSNSMMFGQMGVDFILYPSIEQNSHFCNMAFNPNSADSYLKFEKVLHFKIGERQGSNLKYRIGSLGILNNTNIQWKQPELDEIQFFPHNSEFKIIE